MKSHQIWWQSTRNLRSYQQANKIYVENTVLIGLKRNAFCSQFFSHWISFNGHPEGTFECNLTGRCPFFKNPHNPFRKKICISIPCFGIIRLQNIPKNNTENNSILFFENTTLLFLKTIAYCS